VTIARILRELEERAWIERSERGYEVTPEGEWVCDEFTRLLDEVKAERRLREPLEWMPSDLLTFDVRCLRDADVVTLDGSDMTTYVRRVREFHRSGDRIRGIAREWAPEAIENQWELTVNGDSRIEMVVIPKVVSGIRDHPPASRRFRELLEEENAEYFVTDDIPISVGIVDDTVGINLTDEDGVVKAGLMTDDETVYEWAVDLFEIRREDARPVTPDEITP